MFPPAASAPAPDPAPPVRRAEPPRRLARRIAVVLAAVGLHALAFGVARSELDWELPPTAQVVPVQLFTLPAPLAVSAAAAPPPARPRAIRAPAPADPAGEGAAADPGAGAEAAPPPAAAAPEAAAADAAPPPSATAPTQAAPAPTPAAEASPAPADAAVAKVLVTLPAYGRLVSVATASRGLLFLRGVSVTEWQLADGQYSASSEVRDEFDNVWLRLTSRGTLRPDVGIAPVRYTERGGRRAEVATNFQWDAGKVTFSATAAEFPLLPGVQDRVSIIAQLGLLAAAFPERFAPGATVALPVAGTRDVRTYQMRVVGWDTIRTGKGPMESLKLDRALEPDQKDARFELWLAPALRWLPARSRTSLPNGDVIETIVEEASFDAPR